MTNSAAPGGVSSSCRGGDARYGCGRSRTRAHKTALTQLRQRLLSRGQLTGRLSCLPTVLIGALMWSVKDSVRGVPVSFQSGALTPRYPPVYNFSATQEDSMKTPWQVRRTTVAQHDGERRWDYAYQFLLQWAMEHNAGSRPAPSHPQEESHGSRSLRPCLHEPSATAPDD